MGYVVFSLGSALTVAGLVLAVLGCASDPRAGWIVVLVAAGHALSLASVSFVEERHFGGRAGAPWVQVGAGRTRLGVGLLVAHLALYFSVWSAAVLSYAKATPDDSFPTVFGLSFGQQGPVFVWSVVAAELLFVGAVLAFGHDWWRHFTRLFRYEPEVADAVAEPSEEAPSLRYHLGVGVFIVGNVLASAGLLLPALGFAKGRMVGAIAVMLGAGEVLSLASIFFLGKEGFKKVKSKLFGLFKRVPSGEPTSHRRHRVGCTLLALHVVLQLGALVFPIASHYGVAQVGTFPDVLGLAREQQLQWFVGLLACAEVLFFAGVYALGADWWARFQALFEWGSGSSR